MRCPTCKTNSSHVHVGTDGSITCHKCGGFSESGGSSTDKILTRNSTRVTEQQMQYEQDLITPYVVDKSTNKAVVNEEFINLYPEQAAQTYTKVELKSVGQPDLKPQTEVDDGRGIEFTGDESESIGEIIEKA